MSALPLDSAQAAAVRHNAGPAFLMAGPGTGKTRTLVERARYLAETGTIWIHDCLFLTFSRKAAAEIRQRLGETLEEGADRADRADRLPIRTFHGLCWHILRRHAAGHTDRPPRLYLPGMARSILTRAMAEVAAGDRAGHPAADRRGGQTESPWGAAELWDLIAPAREAGLSPEAFAQSESAGERFVADVYARYVALLEADHAYDFPGLLASTLALLETEPGLLARLQAQHSVILVDEGQDTSLPQWRLVRLLAGLKRQVMVVAAPAQEIYSWRGTDWRALEAEVLAVWPETSTLALDQNYRSSAQILRCATALLDGKRYPDLHVRAAREQGAPVSVVRLTSDTEEAPWVVAQIQSWLREGRPAREIAVLARTGRQLAPIAQALELAGVPRDLVGRHGLLEQAEVRHVLAYLALATLEEKAAARHIGTVLNVPPRGIGQVAQQTLRGEDSGPFTWVQLRRAAAGEIAILKPAAREGVRTFLEQVAALGAHAAEAPATLIDLTLQLTGYYRWLSGQDEDAGVLANLDVLREQATGHETVRGFLDSIDRRLLAQDQALPGDGVQLATFHAAKGLEFDAVLVIGCEEGLVPHARAVSEAELEAERRSFYVALTRARDHEVLLSCAERGGRRTPPSRFLRDLPPDAIHTERRATYG